MMRVRLANQGDVGRATEMISAHVQSCKVAFPEPSEARVEKLIVMCGAGHSVLTIVCEDDGELIGFGCASYGSYLWADELYGQVAVVCVDPKRRGGKAFIKMMNVIESWLTEAGCVRASFTCSTGNDDEKTARMLAKIGWEQVGIDTVKELRHAS